MPAARLIQTRSDMSARYELIFQDKVIYTAQMPVNLAGYPIRILKNGETYGALRRNSLENMKNVARSLSNAELGIFDICIPAGSVRGKIYRRWIRKFNSYYMTGMELDGVHLDMYEVGLGKKGIKLPVFRDGVQIALIEKDSVTRDNCDSYTILFSTLPQLLAAFFLALYYDLAVFSNAREVSVKSKKTYYFLTTNREVKSKYDPDWRPEE